MPRYIQSGQYDSTGPVSAITVIVGLRGIRHFTSLKQTTPGGLKIPHARENRFCRAWHRYAAPREFSLFQPSGQIRAVLFRVSEMSKQKYNDLVYTNEVLKIVSTYTPLGMDEAAPLADTAKHGCCRCLP